MSMRENKVILWYFVHTHHFQVSNIYVHKFLIKKLAYNNVILLFPLDSSRGFIVTFLVTFKYCTWFVVSIWCWLLIRSCLTPHCCYLVRYIRPNSLLVLWCGELMFFSWSNEADWLVYESSHIKLLAWLMWFELYIRKSSTTRENM